MTLRRGLALGLTIAAVATVVPSAAAAPVAAHSKPTICVALVVDGRALGSSVSTTCAKVPRGSTGLDVLEAAGHHVGFRSDGLLCTIDGLPKSGCADVDDTHYWAYFHRAPGSTTWTYSSEGPSTYQPVNKSTEGWVYDNGKSRTPDNVPYAQICKPAAAPAPTPTTYPTTTSPPQPAPTPSTNPATSARRHHHRPPHSPAAKDASRHSAATSPTSASPAPSTSSSAPTLLAGAVSPPASHHGWVGLIIGLVVVLALGGLAATRFRRSGRSP
jgi:hypothetical protein